MIVARLRRLLRRAPGPPDVSSPVPRDAFLAWAAMLGTEAAVLEVGTLQSVPGRSTHLRSAFPHVPRANYLMADVAEGADVDCLADLHALPADWTGRFDACVAIAVFEHLERPWIAAREIARVLKPGGRCYIATHQTYPLHGYPSDFFRFSKDALALLFADAGLHVAEAGYEHRTWIRLPTALVPRWYLKRSYVEAWNKLQPSYLIVHLMAEKPAA